MIWVFTGQGAQWAQMGKELLEHEPLFQQQINALDDVLAGLPDPPPWTLKGTLENFNFFTWANLFRSAFGL